MFVLKCLLWIALESVWVSAFMNILRPNSGCGGISPCQGPLPQIPFIPQQQPCGQFPCPIQPPIPIQPPMVPAVQHGSHYSGQNPTPAPVTPTTQKCTSDGGGICALACNVTGFTEDASDRYTCGIHGDVCCIIPVG